MIGFNTHSEFYHRSEIKSSIFVIQVKKSLPKRLQCTVIILRRKFFVYLALPTLKTVPN